MSYWVGTYGFDLGIGLLLLAGLIWGIWRGVTRELISLLGLMAILIVTIWGSAHVAHLLESLTTVAWLRQTAGALTIFIVAMLAYLWFAHRFHRTRDEQPLSLPHRLIGGLLGMVKLGLIGIFGFILLTRFYPETSARLTSPATLGPPLTQAGQLMAQVLPANLQTRPQPSPRQPRPGKPHAKPAPRDRTRAKEPGISSSDDQALRRLIRERMRDP